LWWSGRANEFACRDVKGTEQGDELAVKVGAHLGDRGEAEGGDCVLGWSAAKNARSSGPA
jgi:hypothetical protein